MYSWRELVVVEMAKEEEFPFDLGWNTIFYRTKLYPTQHSPATNIISHTTNTCSIAIGCNPTLSKLPVIREIPTISPALMLMMANKGRFFQMGCFQGLLL